MLRPIRLMHNGFLMKLTKNKIISFQQFIWEYYAINGRQFAWRHVDDPYKIVVSEIMLQQTQTYRVAPKYELWIQEFPTFAALAEAPLRDILSVWQGLGYNRRAMALQKIAQKIMAEFEGKLPANPEILETFPGIGPATARSICAFAFNFPGVFIETNIRAVYIHSFFPGKNEIHDKELYPLVEQTVDKKNPREWYYALMDYGVMLKAEHKNPSRKSAHHVKQSKFEGSDRQIRGMILKFLTNRGAIKEEELIKMTKKESERVLKIMNELIGEGFIKKDNGNVLSVV